MTSLQSLTILTIVLLLFACKAQNDKQSKETKVEINYPDAFIKGLDAHGGLEKWQEQASLEFSFLKNNYRENNLVDLKSRKSLITYKDWKLGFDGEEVWISPNKEAFGDGSPRFYHNLYFYFFAMPFVLADPGITYEVMKNDSLNGKLYTPVKIQFGTGVGDAPDDEYIAYFDVNDHKMGALLYTVTYYSGSKSKRFNALIYDNWVDVDGLLLPGSMKGYKYADGELGDLRYELQFENVALGKTIPDPALFEMPEQAEIDTLLKH